MEGWSRRSYGEGGRELSRVEPEEAGLDRGLPLSVSEKGEELVL